MALEKQILEQLKAITVRLNEWESNAKRTEEFPELTTFQPESKIRVSFDTDSYWTTLNQLLSYFGIGAFSEKQPYIVATEGQEEFMITDADTDNVDVFVNGVFQIQGIDEFDDYQKIGNIVNFNYPLTEGDKVSIRSYSKNNQQNEFITPIAATYANISALIAAQGNQKINYIYEVTDGSGFTGVPSGALWVKYKGTTAANESDYTWQPRPSGAGLVDSVNSKVGDVVLTEEDIFGTATYNGATTGASDLDVSVFSSHFALLTGNTVHTLIGLPASGKSVVKTWIVRSSTTQTYSIANADKVVGEYLADGTDTRVTAEISMFPTIGQYIVITYENLR